MGSQEETTMKRLLSFVAMFAVLVLATGPFGGAAFAKAKPTKTTGPVANGGGTGGNASSKNGAHPSPTPNGVANSGSIKIATPTSPTDAKNNEPHPGCAFRVDFYGFRAATYSITLTGVAPTGGGQLIPTQSITIPESAHGNTYQASRTFDLNSALAGVTPQPQQGYHIRVDVKKDGSPGEGAKTKVFWLECSSSSDTSVQGANVAQLNKGAEVLGLQVSNTANGTNGSNVLGAQAANGSNVLGAQAANGALARTGLPMAPLALFAGGLLIAGALLRRTGRPSLR